jgi:hypothetical protein
MRGSGQVASEAEENACADPHPGAHAKVQKPSRSARCISSDARYDGVIGSSTSKLVSDVALTCFVSSGTWPEHSEHAPCRPVPPRPAGWSVTNPLGWAEQHRFYDGLARREWRTASSVQVRRNFRNAVSDPAAPNAADLVRAVRSNVGCSHLPRRQ